MAQGREHCACATCTMARGHCRCWPLRCPTAEPPAERCRRAPDPWTLPHELHITEDGTGTGKATELPGRSGQTPSLTATCARYYRCDMGRAQREVNRGPAAAVGGSRLPPLLLSFLVPSLPGPTAIPSPPRIHPPPSPRPGRAGCICVPCAVCVRPRLFAAAVTWCR